MSVNIQWAGLNWAVLLASIRPFWFRSGTPSLWRPTPESRRRSLPSTSWRLLGTWTDWSINYMTLATEASPPKRYCILYHTIILYYIQYSVFCRSGVVCLPIQRWKPDFFSPPAHIVNWQQIEYGFESSFLTLEIIVCTPHHMVCYKSKLWKKLSSALKIGIVLSQKS